MSHFEFPNNRGPLFDRTTNFNVNFIPPLSGFFWHDSLPSTVQFTSYEAAMNMEYSTQNMERIMYLSDESVNTDQLASICERHRLQSLIVKRLSIAHEKQHLRTNGVTA